MKIIFIFFISFSLHAEVLPKGTILTCPGDNFPVLKTTRDYSPDLTFISSQGLESIVSTLKVEKHMPFHYACNAVVGNCAHTKKGWWPESCLRRATKGIKTTKDSIAFNLNAKDCLSQASPTQCLAKLHPQSRRALCGDKESYAKLKSVTSVEKYMWDNCTTSL